MIAFHTRFPELAARETRSIRVVTPGGELPVGEYGFIEHFCADAACDCRRVLLRVTSAQPPHAVLATINFGWESADFYIRWTHGDEKAGRDITAASLDPLHPQSKHADELLAFFRKAMITDPAYVQRLARHYEIFKQDQRPPVESAKDDCAARLLSVPEILRQLQRLPDQADFAPYEAALRAAREQREAITPELIAAIDHVSANPGQYRKHDEASLYLFAICLLAEFREPRALDSFLRFFSLPGDLALDMTGDLVLEQGAAVLASVCGGDPAPLLQLIHDEAVNEFVRAEAVNALAVQSLWGERPREALVEELRRLFKTLPKPGNGYIWAVLATLLCDFHVPELAPEARQTFDEGLVDESVLDWPWLEKELAHGREKSLKHFSERYAHFDAVAECSGWLCFRDENENFKKWDDDEEEEDIPDEPFRPPPNEQTGIRTPTPYIAPGKVGRNDPCPCGSSRKYKKCCGK
jgi:hypothetical protein